MLVLSLTFSPIKEGSLFFRLRTLQASQLIKIQIKLDHGVARRNGYIYSPNLAHKVEKINKELTEKLEEPEDHEVCGRSCNLIQGS